MPEIRKIVNLEVVMTFFGKPLQNPQILKSRSQISSLGSRSRISSLESGSRNLWWSLTRSRRFNQASASTTTVSTMGVGRRALDPWILKISAKKVLFLVSSGKKQISPLLVPLEKIWKNPLVPPSLDKILLTTMVSTTSLDIGASNRSIEFNDALNMVMLCIEMCQRVFGEQKIGWAVPLHALRRNGHECAAKLYYIQRIKSGVTRSLSQGELSWNGPALIRCHLSWSPIKSLILNRVTRIYVYLRAVA